MAQEIQSNSIIPTQEIPSLLSRYQLLPQLMRGIVIDRAIGNYSCTDAEREQAIEHFERQQHITDPESREAWLKKSAMSAAQLAEVAVRSLLIEKFKQDTWGAKIESYFMNRKAAFDQVIFSLLRTSDGLLAQEIYFRILEGEQTFAEMSQQYSKGAEANTAGVVGPVPLAQLNPALAKILSISQPGQLWRPTRIENWFAIVRLEKLLPAQLNANMRQRLLNEMFETWLSEQIQQLEPLQFSWS